MAGAGGPAPSSLSLYVYNGGFLWQRRVRRILALAGYSLRLGRPGPEDRVGVWGDRATAKRGLAVADRCGAKLVRVEDAFIRSVHPGRRAEAPIGLIIDEDGLHFDPRRPSKIERILQDDPLDNTALLDRARSGIFRMRSGHISKFSAFDPAVAPPDPGYVLVIDQVQGDASVRHSKGDAARFAEMLTEARLDHPGARILVKAPATGQGYLTDLPPGVELITDPVSPWHLLDGAIAVYVLSSQMGFEAILAGHRPIVFGQPFYAGWGLTEDRMPIDRRQRKLTRAQLFAGAMILAPHWYDPYRDRLGTFEDALGAIEAQSRAWREDRHGWVAADMRLWKRRHIQSFFGQSRGVRFRNADAAAYAARTGARHMGWGAASTAPVRCEDGFIRSRGLGADLVPPASLVLDDLGIYYDPSQESRLERLIAEAATLPPAGRHLAEELIHQLRRARVSKYNTGAAADLPARLPGRRRVLVAGQVEDDASILLGAGDVRSNRDLLLHARAAHPTAELIYKPHPDVEAGLRPGAVPDASDIAEIVLHGTDPIHALGQVDELWVMTSLLGFEALLRDVPVTCLGGPFYAGWGLTTDLGPVPKRRVARPDLVALVHAVLIAYPRYLDPVTRQVCPAELIIDRLAAGEGVRSPGLRMLAKAQGMLAGRFPFWR